MSDIAASTSRRTMALAASRKMAAELPGNAEVFAAMAATSFRQLVNPCLRHVELGIRQRG